MVSTISKVPAIIKKVNPTPAEVKPISKPVQKVEKIVEKPTTKPLVG